jgi:hypothetical protein
MKIKPGLNLHNRFDVVKNSEWVGYAENIILDQMYSRVCNLSEFFVNIHFGTGTGTPTPDRTSLFSHLGTKSAVFEERIYADPTSKIVKRIVLNPEEYVNQTITEVGVAYGSSSTYLVTHAMIKDSEGNPLSINKTDLDVIEIYATVFITLSTSDGNLLFMGPRNNFIRKLLDNANTSYSSTVYLQDCPWLAKGENSSDRLGAKETTTTVNVTARTRTSTCRFGISEGNGEISRIQFGTSLVRVLPITGIFESHQSTNVILGVGDGVTTEFLVPNRRIDNLSVKIDGVVTNDYTVATEDDYYSLPTIPLSTRYGASFDMSYGQFMYRLNGVMIIGMPMAGLSGSPMQVGYLDPTDGISAINLGELGGAYGSENYYVSDDGKILRIYYGHMGTNVYIESDGTQAWLRSAPEGVTWTSVYPASSGALVVEDYKSFTLNGAWCLQKLYPNAISKVIFNTAPAQDVEITADYTTPCAPKDENYVFDVTVEYTFGEGV